MNESNGSMELYLREHTEEIINKWLSKIYENENTYTSFVTRRVTKMNCALTVNKQRT